MIPTIPHILVDGPYSYCSALTGSGNLMEIKTHCAM
jgi:hypothetical protein